MPRRRGSARWSCLSDGTVIGTQGKNWYKLTPDSSGSYVNGTWSTMASMSLERLYDATNVLPDGRVFVVGGEYSGPQSDRQLTPTPVKSTIPSPTPGRASRISRRAVSATIPACCLPDGRVLVG